MRLDTLDEECCSWREEQIATTSLQARYDGGDLISKIRRKLEGPPLHRSVEYVACVYYQRFFSVHTIEEFDAPNVALACLFLAAKVEETPRKIRKMINAYRQATGEVGEQSSEQLAQQSQLVQDLERLILCTLNFKLEAGNSYMTVVRCLEALDKNPDRTDNSTRRDTVNSVAVFAEALTALCFAARTHLPLVLPPGELGVLSVLRALGNLKWVPEGDSTAEQLLEASGIAIPSITHKKTYDNVFRQALVLVQTPLEQRQQEARNVSAQALASSAVDGDGNNSSQSAEEQEANGLCSVAPPRRGSEWQAGINYVMDGSSGQVFLSCQTVLVNGKKATAYMCSCKAWACLGSFPRASRTCKHLRQARGDDHERQRLGAAIFKVQCTFQDKLLARNKRPAPLPSSSNASHALKGHSNGTPNTQQRAAHSLHGNVSNSQVSRHTNGAPSNGILPSTMGASGNNSLHSSKRQRTD